MTDASIDMAPFFARHDRATRWIFEVTLALSVAVAAGSMGYAAGAAVPVGTELWVLMILIPVVVIAFRTAILRWGGKRQHRPDGTLPMNPDDARSARRVANAGALFVAGIGMAMIATQVSVALENIDAFAPWVEGSGWLGRLGLAAMGALMAHFGNAWPLMPTPRGPGRKPAAHKTFNRLYGWVVALAGVVFMLAALLLPARAMSAVIGAASLGLMVAVAAIVIWLRKAVKSPSAT